MPAEPGAWRTVREAAARHPVAAAAVVLVALQLWFLLSAPALPGQNAQYPAGWWGWFDQGKYLESARAFALRSLDPARHWYPPGYALLGAPFIRWKFQAHPFALVDLACLLGTLWAFVAVAGACGLRRGTAAVLFVAALVWDIQSFEEWSIPWNSTPAALLVWVGLAMGARGLGAPRRAAVLGVVCGLLPLMRPTEVPALGAAMLVMLAVEWRAGRLTRASLLALAGGAVAVAVLAVALHLAIYGPRASEYMLISRRLGFTLWDFGWKAYVLLVDPYQWFLDGHGLLQRLPFVALGLAGLVPGLLRGRASAMLAAALLVHLLVFVSYVDLLPTGLWRFNNLHYFKWAIPGYALLGALLVRDLVRWRWAVPQVASAIAVVLLAGVSLVRVAPVPAAADGPAKMLFFPGDAPGFDQSYFGDWVVRDALGMQDNITAVRGFPVPGGMRVIALRRPFVGAVTLERAGALSPGLVAATPERFVAAPVLGRPCWVPFTFCGRRPANTLMPPPPRG